MTSADTILPAASVRVSDRVTVRNSEFGFVSELGRGLRATNLMTMTIASYAHAKISDTMLTSDTNAVPSSPLPAVFSDRATRSATPPSSPPGFPWEMENVAVNASKTPPRAKSAFSVLGKRKALDSLSENARPAKKVATSTKPAETKTLTQMQISLGQEVQKKCKTCGMEYVPSSAEDRKLHDKYHKQNSEGYDVGKDFVSKARNHSLFPGAKKEDRICAIDCFDSHARKRRGQAVLEIVQRELGAVEIPKEDIWDIGRCEDTHVFVGEPTFRAYLYVGGLKCIGFLLVQKIKEAYHVVEPASSSARQLAGPDNGEQRTATGALAVLKALHQASAQQLDQPIQLSKHPSPAQLGISRIWTSPTHRHQSIATTLLDTAFRDYNERVERGNAAKMNARKEMEGRADPVILDYLVPTRSKMERKDAVAFSQPTEAGVRLARRWFGRSWGWGVYVD